MDLSPKALLVACSESNDEMVWTEFIRRFQVVIASAVLRTARLWEEPSRSLLDDLIQETYLKLCEDGCRLLRSFHPQREDSVYGFLKVVAANVVHDHFRLALAAKRGVKWTQTMDSLPMEPKTAAPDSFDLLSHRLRLEQVDKILSQVTAGKDQERKRIIFWLRHRQGLTASEIADIPSIGLTTEGVESVLVRLAVMIRDHYVNSTPHREVKGFSRKIRSKRLGS